MRLGSGRADRRCAAQHDVRRPRRDAAQSAARTSSSATASKASTSRSTRPRASGPASSPSRRSTSSSTTCARPRRCAPASGRGSARGRTFERRPPMIMECSYAVTAWTQAVEDEHRLLSQVLAIFFAYPELPQDKLNGRLANGSQAWPIKGRDRPGQGREVGLLERGRRPVQGVARLRRPAVGRVGRSARARPGSPHADRPHADDRRPARAVIEMHRSVGRVSDKKGEPLADVWVTLPDVGKWTSSAADGRFASTACLRAAIGCWRAPRTAGRRTRSSRSPAPGSSS